MDDDISRSLDELRVSRPTSLRYELVEIQKYKKTCPRDFTHIRSLKCLSISGHEIHRNPGHILNQVILPEVDGRFAAVSYSWRSTAFENDTTGGYTIMRGQPGRSEHAKVRDVILDRVIKYIVSSGIPAFWIDQECIDQKDEEAKVVAMQSMDVIYRRSLYPIGMLSTPLQYQDEVDLLSALLKKDLVVWQSVSQVPQLAAEVDISKARKVLDVLFRIMCDPWWTRRWIFQEEYCAMGRMQLLIPYLPGLSKVNGAQVFGTVDGELSIKAALFRQQVTLFCMVSHHNGIWRSKRDKWQCKLVLERAKKYNMLQKYGWVVGDDSEHRAMSTRILADISRRSAKISSDTLAIMANCCGYATRLDVESLNSAKLSSLSLAILALFILNGEILRPTADGNFPGTVLEFLKEQSFQGFDPPKVDRKLTFLKRCRLSDVVMCEEGIQATGYLWTVCKVLQSKSILQPARQTATSQDSLRQLVNWLHDSSYSQLANNIESYLAGEMPSNMESVGLREIFDSMAERVAKAMEAHQSLIIARLVGHDQIWALFIKNKRRNTSSLIFTSCEAAEDRFSEHRSRFLDKYVSLQVVESSRKDDALPRIQIKSWINGLWFADSVSPKAVILPWPRFLCDYLHDCTPLSGCRQQFDSFGSKDVFA